MRFASAAGWTGLRVACNLVLLTALACERFDETPREVAAAFWAAIGARDLETAHALSDAPSAADLQELADSLALEDVMLDQILRNEASALVETRAVLVRTEMDLDFKTHLTRAGETWRVDIDETESELRRSALAATFSDVQESIRESTDLLVEEFEKRALGASEMLREALEDLEDTLREQPPPSPST